MKVALISTSIFPPSPDLKYGGLEAVVHNLGMALAKDGHEVLVVGTKGTQVEGCQVLETVEFTGDLSAFGQEKDAYEIWKDEVHDYDVIHGHSWMAYEYLYGRDNGDATVLHTHHGHLTWGIPPPVKHPNLIGISNFMALEYGKQGYVARYAYNGINLENYPFKEKKGDRLLYVGRFTSYKGAHLALDIAKQARMGIDLVGSTTFVEDQKYVQQIWDKCDGEQLRMWGEVPTDVKVKLMQNAKAILIPSQMGEPFGLIAAEAMACGTPAICLNDGALKEVVSQGLTGYICDSTDQMVKAIDAVEEIEPKRCRQRVQNLFTKEVMAKTYLALYREAQSGGW